MKKVPIVYLAGGMAVAWRAMVKRRVSRCIFIDPTEHGLGTDENAYTAWDLSGVDAADIVFAYAEDSNHSCIGMAVEMGWAAKADKRIIYVQDDTHPKAQYLGMMRSIATVRTKSLEDGIARLVQDVACFPPHRINDN